MNILIIPIITALGMLGGQKIKAFKRFGIPTVSLAFKVFKESSKKEKKKSLWFLLYGLFLSMGYGESSFIAKICRGADRVTRIVYGLLLSIPLCFLDNFWGILFLPLAFSIRAGGFKIGKYDWLWEDFIRYGTLGTLIYFTL